MDEEGDQLVVSVTPTVGACPAVTEIHRELHRRLTEAGLGPVEVRRVLAPPWSSEWITAEGRTKLRAAGVAPPRSRPASAGEPVPARRCRGACHDPVPCPRCGSAATVELAPRGPTPCTALWRCGNCLELFEWMREGR